MRVDAHQHVWDLSVREQAWLGDPALAAIQRSFLIDEYDALARTAGIDASVLVQTVADPEETGELFEIADRSPVVAAVVGWVDLTSPDAADDLAQLLAHPSGRWLRGIRHQVQSEPDARWLCRDDVRRGLSAVADASLLYELVVLPEQLPAVVETVRDLPGLRFVLDHCGKPPVGSGELGDWAARIQQLAALPNISCKLSGLVTEADWGSWSVADLKPYAEVVVNAFGADRLMIGSDWPVSLLAGGFDDVLDAYVGLIDSSSPEEQAAMRGGTAAAEYRIT